MPEDTGTETLAKNTAAQKAAHEAHEARVAEEQTWPLWQVEIEGDEVPWEPRPDTMYWQQEDPNDPRTKWIPKDKLPSHARVENGMVVKKARATVNMHAKTEQMAQMMALRDNPDYHTITSTEKVKEGDE
jgi:hypothetical protein